MSCPYHVVRTTENNYIFFLEFLELKGYFIQLTLACSGSEPPKNLRRSGDLIYSLNG